MSVSGVSSNSSSSAASTGTANSGVNPTNQGTVTFTGLGSGLDYQSIIKQLTSISQQQEVPFQNKIAQVTAQNTELKKIQGLLATFQGSLNALSDPKTFGAYAATVPDGATFTAEPTPGQTAVPGSYTITDTKLGTATSVLGAATIGHKIGDNLPSGPASNTVSLVDSYVQTRPTNGGIGSGLLTVNGTQVSYDVNSQSLDTILANIQSQVRTATGDASFTASYDYATDKVSFTSSNKPISLGSASDQGNLLTVLKLDSAQITNTASSGNVASSNTVGGVSYLSNFNSKNSTGDAVNANFATPVTAGVFTINGVRFTVDPTKQGLSDVIGQINASSAGVSAAFDANSGRVSLTNKTAGAQSVVVGSSGDTSNFLTAVGLASGAGGVSTLGTQSSVTYLDATGVSRTAYSNDNNVKNAIPGFTITVTETTSATIPKTVAVSQTADKAIAAIKSFTDAYNGVINELNAVLQAPVVSQNGSNSQSLGGGVFYGNSIMSQLKNQLVNLVSGLQAGNGSNYNSLAAIGLTLSSSFQTITSSSSAGSSVSGSTNTSLGASGLSLQTLQGTDGQLTALNEDAFKAAFSANPQAVTNLFTNASNFVTKIGALLTSQTGQSTILASGIAGQRPTQSVLAGLQQQNDGTIAAAQARIAQIEQQIQTQANLLSYQFQASSQTITSLTAQQSYLAQISGGSSSGG